MPHDVERVPGDLLDPRSLDRALDGVSAAITTATGYNDWNAPNPAVDSEGNRNLVDATKRSTVGRLVFTSVLSADNAQAVAPFWQKKLTEDYLEKQDVPFVALRPGTIVGGTRDFWSRELAQSRLTSMSKPDVPISFVHIDDVARYLVDALGASDVLGRRIDIAAAPAASYRDLALFSHILNREVALRSIPCPLSPGRQRLMAVTGLFKPSARRFWTLMRYLSSGVYVADTASQRTIFGEVPSLEETLWRHAEAAGLVAGATATNVATPARERA